MKHINFAMEAAAIEMLSEYFDPVPDQGAIQDTILAELLKQREEDFTHTVDRRIKFIKYVESQLEAAKGELERWKKRRDKMEALLEAIKKDTIDVMHANPSLSYKGELGTLKVQRNSQPSLVLTGGFEAPKDYIRLDPVLDRAKLKTALIQGAVIPGAELKHGEHLRVTV